MTEASLSAPDVSGTAPAADVVERYVAFWNATTTDEQHRLGAATFSDDISYHAPLGLMHGVDELIGFRNQFAAHVPAYGFRPRTEPQFHHDRARLQWELVVAGASFATGTDVLELDGEGHIATITTFLDRAPEGFTHIDH